MMRNLDRELLLTGIVGVLFTGCLIWLVSQNAVSPGEESARTYNRTTSLLWKFRYESYDADELVSILEADELVVRPRRLFVFNVRNINELSMKNARFSVYLQKGGDHDTSPFSVVDGVLFPDEQAGGNHEHVSLPRRFGRITRAVIVNLTQRVYTDNVLSTVITANRAIFLKKNGKPEYHGTSIIDVKSGRRILCKKALWNKRERRFEIAGDYWLINTDQKRRGKGISVDLDFNMKPM